MSEASRAPELIDCLSASSAIGGGPIIYIFARVPDAIRTPDELFEDLPDYPFAPHHRDLDGLRLAHLDEGDGEPVVFFHGEPTWSFLWRKVIPPVRDAGYRCIAPDLPVPAGRAIVEEILEARIVWAQAVIAKELIGATLAFALLCGLVAALRNFIQRRLRGAEFK